MKKIVVSFDVDGTMEFGDPPGPVTLEMVKRARELGCIVGSCSDRTLSSQQELWKIHNIEVDFTVLKHNLIEVKKAFEAEVYLHTGDTEMDRQRAREAGFDFIWMIDAAAEPWIEMRDGAEPL